MEAKREAEIIREVLIGNVHAFEALVREYQAPIYGLMLRMLGDPDEAADCAQDSFTRAYGKLAKFKIGNRFFPWLYSLSMNVARDRLRSKGREITESMEDPEIFADASWSESQGELASFLDGSKAFDLVLELKPKYREALLLRFKYDFTMKEIANALGISVSGAKMRVSRGLDMVRHMMEEASHDR